MHRSSLLMIGTLLVLCLCSIVYFLSLPLHVPVGITALLLAVGAFFLFRFLHRRIPAEPLPANSAGARWGYLVLAAGMALLLNKAYYIIPKYGEWDAWWFWNLHAKYLSQPTHWHEPYFNYEIFKTFTSPVPHADYPLFLPASVGFFWRLSGVQAQIIPYTISILAMIAIPAIVFIELSRKNLLVASLLLLYLVTDEVLLHFTTAQFADGYIALFLLLCFVCMEHYRRDGRAIYLQLAGAFAGCCLWTKNEGIMLALVFAVVYAPFLLKAGRWKHLLTGVALPLLALLLFKTVYAPSNDLVQGQGGKTLEKLKDGNRYKLIWDIFKMTLNKYFPYLSYLTGAYLLKCAVARQLPQKGLLVILLAALGYAFIYLVTPHDLEWHMYTSVDRLMFQLTPSLLFLIGTGFSDLRLKLDPPSAQQ